MSDTSRRDLRAARTARRRGTRLRFVVTQALLLDVLFAVGAVAVWPIYRTPLLFIAIGVGLLAAHIVAAVGLRRTWSLWWVVLAALVAYVALGVPVAAPASLTSPSPALRALLGVVTAPVTGWKDLLTLDLPLGSYQTTLAPTLFLFTVIPALALSLAWRARTLWTLAAPLGLLLTVFGVVFGARSLSAPLVAGPVRVQPELVVGTGAVLAALAVVVWRTRYERRRALEAAVEATGVRRSGRATRGLLGRLTTAVAMVLIAVVGASTWAPWALGDQPRSVARATVDPVLRIAETLSPLSQYRGAFAPGEDERVLFRVDATAPVDRVRIATLPFYDGRNARAVDPSAGLGSPQTAFRRVPAGIAGGGGSAASVTVTIDGLTGIWVPTAGDLRTATFDGARATDLSDGFFYNAATGAAVQLAEPGLRSGDAYRLDVTVRGETGAAASLDPVRSGPALPAEVVPDSLREWIEAQGAPTGGEGLGLLLDRLRARGFLSHALSIDPAAPPAWLADLGTDAFQPSRAGHSTDRIDALFTQLLDRQREIGGDVDADLVAGVGDDEQFAVAAMMIADQLGFDARVVVGTRLSDVDGLPACEGGECRNADLAAWIEVADAGGAWHPLDVTPQRDAFPSPDLEQRQDPENPTDVRRDQAEQVLPAEAGPTEGTERGEDADTDAADLEALWATLRVVGVSFLGLLILVGPLLLIVVAKALRRRSRRRAPDVVERFTGGWQEFVDAAVDHGYPAPATQTRQELAAIYAGEDRERVARLATWADRSVFDVVPPPRGSDAGFWQIVDDERQRLAAEAGFWARLRGRVSLRSLRRRRPARRRR